MGKRSEEELSPVLIKAREEYAEKQKKEPDSVVNFRNSLIDKNARKAFNKMFNIDGSFTEEGKKDFERFKKIPFSVDGSECYYVYSTNSIDLFKFLCFYILKEKKYRQLLRVKELEKLGKNIDRAKDDVFNLMPVVTFISTFVQEEVNPTQVESNWGDSHGTIMVFYIPNSSLYGNQMAFYASVVKNYIAMKKCVDEQVIVLAEAEFDEFTAASSFPIINLHTGKISLNTRVIDTSSSDVSLPNSSTVSSNRVNGELT